MTTDQFVGVLPALYAQLQPRAYRLCRNADEAEDLRAETLSRAWSHRQQISHPKTWAQVTCKNAFLHKFREPPMEPLDEMEIELAAAPEPDLSDEESLEQLRRGIARLKPIHQRAVRRYLSGRRCAGTWGSRLHTARKAIRKSWNYATFKSKGD